MTRPLAEQTVLVTGAAQGLGRAVAQAFGAAGARLILVDRDGAALAGVAESIGDRARPLEADLADAASTGAAVAAIDGPVDTLVHNAAILRPERLTEVSLETFRATLDVGIQAAFLLSRAVWDGMAARGGGALIFVSSQSGIRGFADETAYCAAKHALEGFSKCLALEAGDTGIVSCTITPGKAMHTPMSERNYPPDLKKQWIDPARLAPAFLHIAATRDPSLNGQRLNAWHMALGHDHT